MTTETETTSMVEYEAPEGGAVVPVAKSAGDYRTESVGHFLDGAYARASTLQLTEQEAKQLAEDFPDDAFRLGAGGNKNLIYIEHAYLRKRLNDTLGVGASVPVRRREWTEQFTYFDDNGKQHPAVRIYVELVLVVRGCVVGEAVGDAVYYPENAATNYSDALESAKSAAFRRTCKEFGIGLQAWMKGWSEEWKERNRGGTPQREQPRREQPQQTQTTQKAPERKAAEKFREPARWPESTRYDVTEWAETLKTGPDFRKAIRLAESAKLPTDKTHGIIGIIADHYHKNLVANPIETQTACAAFTTWIDDTVAAFAPSTVQTAQFAQPVDWPNTTIDELHKWIDGLVTIADMKQANVMLFGETSPFTSLDERDVLVKHLNQKFHDKYDAMVDGDKAKYEAIAREIDETLYKHELDVQAQNMK